MGAEHALTFQFLELKITVEVYCLKLLVPK